MVTAWYVLSHIKQTHFFFEGLWHLHCSWQCNCACRCFFKHVIDVKVITIFSCKNHNVSEVCISINNFQYILNKDNQCIQPLAVGVTNSVFCIEHAYFLEHLMISRMRVLSNVLKIFAWDCQHNLIEFESKVLAVPKAEVSVHVGVGMTSVGDRSANCLLTRYFVPEKHKSQLCCCESLKTDIHHHCNCCYERWNV